MLRVLTTQGTSCSAKVLEYKTLMLGWSRCKAPEAPEILGFSSQSCCPCSGQVPTIRRVMARCCLLSHLFTIQPNCTAHLCILYGSPLQTGGRASVSPSPLPSLFHSFHKPIVNSCVDKSKQHLAHILLSKESCLNTKTTTLGWHLCKAPETL